MMRLATSWGEGPADKLASKAWTHKESFMNSLRACLASVLFISLASCAANQREATAVGSQTDPAAIARIGPRDAKPRIDSGAALLVCAYDKPEKFRQNQLEGALSLDQLKGRESSLAKETELIFYCA
jgi:hypothetical protein